MLFRMLGLLGQDPVAFIGLVLATALALAIAITVHEFSHGLAAYRLGDDTARRLGRLSLNPLVHLDPLGTLMLFLAGFGWGKPVPVNAHFLRHGRRGMALVACFGPLSNLVVAGLFALPIRLGVVAWHSPFYYLPFSQWQAGAVLADIIGYIILYNIILAVFNLIPIPPLDGSQIAMGLLPRELAYSLARLERYGPMLLLLIIVLDGFLGIGLLWQVLGAAADLFAVLLVGRGF